MGRKFSEYFPGLKGDDPIELDIAVDLGDLNDVNGNELLEFDTVTSAVNQVRIANSAASSPPVISAAGDDTNIGLDLDPKGTGALRVLSAATTGAAVDIVGTALTQGKGIDLSDLDAVTTGKAIHVDATGVTHTSGVLVHLDSAGTAITGAGRIFLSDHTGVTTTSGILNEFASAANDETVIVKVTASDALAAGVMLQLSGASVTTGKAIAATDLNALTTGIGLHLASSATAITTTGRLIYSNHTGVTGTTAILNEFASAANDETVIVKVTASDANALGTALQISSATTTGNGATVAVNALTSGFGLSVTSSATAMTSAGRLLNIDHSGNAGVSTIIAEVKSAAADETTVMRVTASAALAAGVVLDLSATAVTTGTVLDLGGLDALTTGTGINVVSNSATTDTRILVNVVNDNTAATGTTLLTLQNDATAGAHMKFTGTGVLGIDFTGLGATDKLFDATAASGCTAAPQTNAAIGFIGIKIAGTDQWIPYYNAT